MILDDGRSRQGYFAIAALACPYQEESDRDLSGSGPCTALCRPLVSIRHRPAGTDVDFLGEWRAGGQTDTNGSSPPSPSDSRPIASPTDTLASGRAPRRPGTYTGHRSVCDSLWTPKTHESLYRSYRLRRSTESRPQKLAAVPLASVAQSRSPPGLTTGLGRFQDLYDILREDHLLCPHHGGAVW
jgi:hypothetical protein